MMESRTSSDYAWCTICGHGDMKADVPQIYQYNKNNTVKFTLFFNQFISLDYGFVSQGLTRMVTYNLLTNKRHYRRHAWGTYKLCEVRTMHGKMTQCGVCDLKQQIEPC